jgi:diguanylate cyclase (GGDEF)-like protein/PAS domain S-box-containing protein
VPERIMTGGLHNLCGPDLNAWPVVALTLLAAIIALLWLRQIQVRAAKRAAQDLRRLQLVEASLQQREGLYRLLAEHAADMIVRLRADRTRAYVSPAARTLLGFEPRELQEQDFIECVHPEDRSRVETSYGAFIKSGGRTVCSFRLRRKDLTYLWVEATWVSRRSEELAGQNEVIAVVRDISERIAAEERISFLARHDVLTGLPNSALFREHAEHALATRKPDQVAAILCLDCDTFKTITDALGHAAGDALLAAIADRLASCAGETDTLARTGASEFAILMPGLETPDQAAVMARRAIGVIKAPIDIDGQTVSVGVSIGIAIAPTDATGYEDLLRRAGTALLRSKHDCRNTFHFFEPAMDARRLVRQQRELELRSALNEHKFRLVYQPLVSLPYGRVTGFEALLRWHSSNGAVSPAEFIPIAEETGLIVPIGAWVLHEACAHAARWPAPISIAVNLSPLQLRSAGLLETVGSALEKSGLPPERLELEITESVLLEHSDAVLATLYALHDMGIHIAMDDFGTGYSSLRYLRSFPFDKIKLDRSFVADLLSEQDSIAIVRAVAGLGRSLGIATLAEGVENRKQLECLRAEGYHQAQGYYLGRPSSFEDATALLNPLEPSPAILEHAP